MSKPTRAAIRKSIKRTADVVGMAPLDFMLLVMRSEDNDVDTRLEAAKAAAPYVHRKLPQAVEIGNDESGTLRVSVEERRQEALAAIQAAFTAAVDTSNSS